MSKRHYMDNLTPVAQNIWKTDDGLFMFSIDGFEINDPCHVSIFWCRGGRGVRACGQYC